MSKIIPATCVGGVVSIDGLPVSEAEILSEGVAQSSGALLLDEDQALYVAKTSPDLKSTLDQLTTALTQVSDALNQAVLALNILDNKPLGILPPVPAVTANTILITTAATQITAAQAQLSALKESLR